MGENTEVRRREGDGPTSMLTKIKNNVVAIAAVVTAAAVIIVAPINFDNRYAHAGDLKAFAASQEQQTTALKQTVTQQQLNWLEYYNDKIKALQRELQRATPAQSQSISGEIEDVRARKHFLEKSLVESTNNGRHRPR